MRFLLKGLFSELLLFVLGRAFGLGFPFFWLKELLRSSKFSVGLSRVYHENPQPSFSEVITHIFRLKNLHFSWILGSKGMVYLLRNGLIVILILVYDNPHITG